MSQDFEKLVPFDPLLSEIRPDGSHLTEGEIEANWSGLKHVSEETYRLLSSRLVAEQVFAMIEALHISEESASRIASLLRDFYYGKVPFEGLQAKLEFEVKLPRDRALAASDYIRKRIMSLRAPEENEEVIDDTEITAAMSIATEPLILLDALAKYNRINEQPITRERIRVRSERTPVRGTVRNWLRAYRDALGIKQHTSVERAQFLFHSENAKKLSTEERDRVSMLLKSLDDKETLDIDPKKQQIVFPKPMPSLVQPATNVQPVEKNIVSNDAVPQDAFARYESRIAQAAPVASNQMSGASVATAPSMRPQTTSNASHQAAHDVQKLAPEEYLRALAQKRLDTQSGIAKSIANTAETPLQKTVSSGVASNQSLSAAKTSSQPMSLASAIASHKNVPAHAPITAGANMHVGGAPQKPLMQSQQTLGMQNAAPNQSTAAKAPLTNNVATSSSKPLANKIAGTFFETSPKPLHTQDAPIAKNVPSNSANVVSQKPSINQSLAAEAKSQATNAFAQKSAPSVSPRLPSFAPIETASKVHAPTNTNTASVSQMNPINPMIPKVNEGILFIQSKPSLTETIASWFQLGGKKSIAQESRPASVSERVIDQSLRFTAGHTMPAEMTGKQVEAPSNSSPKTSAIAKNAPVRSASSSIQKTMHQSMASSREQVLSPDRAHNTSFSQSPVSNPVSANASSLQQGKISFPEMKLPHNTVVPHGTSVAGAQTNHPKSFGIGYTEPFSSVRKPREVATIPSAAQSAINAAAHVQNER